MGTAISESDLLRLLHGRQGSAFRFEAQDVYELDYEAADYAKFLAGTPAPPPEVSWWRPWLEQITEQVRQGKPIGRVRILAEPPTDYQRWELWAAPWHARAGEQIAYMPRSKARRLSLPDTTDWWLLDDVYLITMQFDRSGHLTGRTLITDEGEIGRHIAWRDLAVRNAIPAEELPAA